MGLSKRSERVLKCVAIIFLIVFNPITSVLVGDYLRYIGYTQLKVFEKVYGGIIVVIFGGVPALAFFLLVIGGIFNRIRKFINKRREKRMKTMKVKKKHPFLRFLLKVIISFLLFMLCTILVGNNGVIGAFDVFYVPFYLVVGLYYFCVVWKRSPTTGEDLLMYPLFRKIKLLNDEGGQYNLRKRLVKEVLPLLLGTFFLNIFSLFLCNGKSFKKYDIPEDPFAIFLLLIPIFCWIAYAAFCYSKRWMNNSEDQNEN